MRVLIIDNFDSFTFNLYQIIGELMTKLRLVNTHGQVELQVVRNNAITWQDIEAWQPDRIVISPGPGTPEDEAYFGISAQVIQQTQVPLLGVCLGMQGIAHCFGGKIIRFELPMHGKTSDILHDEQGLFANIPNPLSVMRYHSLGVDPKSFPDCLRVTAVVGEFPIDGFDDNSKIRRGGSFKIMGLEHRTRPIYGIQHHPESFASEGGVDYLRQFLIQG